MTKDKMVGWYHRLDGHEFEQALAVGDGQGSLSCYSPWGHKESDKTERLNRIYIYIFNYIYIYNRIYVAGVRHRSCDADYLTSPHICLRSCPVLLAGERLPLEIAAEALQLCV